MEFDSDDNLEDFGAVDSDDNEPGLGGELNLGGELVDEDEFDNDSDFDFAAVTPVDETLEAATPQMGEPGDDEDLDFTPGKAHN